MKIRNIVLKSVLCAGMLMSGCGEDVLNKVNPNDLSTQTYFLNEQEIITGVNSCYAAWQALDLYAREYFFIHDLRGDDGLQPLRRRPPRRPGSPDPLS